MFHFIRAEFDLSDEYKMKDVRERRHDFSSHRKVVSALIYSADTGTGSVPGTHPPTLSNHSAVPASILTLTLLQKTAWELAKVRDHSKRAI